MTTLCDKQRKKIRTLMALHKGKIRILHGEKKKRRSKSMAKKSKFRRKRAAAMLEQIENLKMW